MKMKDFKPCPFCGDTYIKVHIGRHYGFVVGCNTVNCICVHVTGKEFKTQEEAVKAWNRRVDEVHY